MYSPDPKRLQRCLSAVLNFAKYREDKLQLLQDFKEAAVDVHTRHAELMQAHSDKVRAAPSLVAPPILHLTRGAVHRPRNWSG